MIISKITEKSSNNNFKNDNFVNYFFTNIGLIGFHKRS